MKYNYSLAELIDRMNIVELKIIHAGTPELKQKFSEEMDLILSDIEQFDLPSKVVRAIGVLSMSNISIWNNESEVREMADGKELTNEEKIILADRLLKTHKLNADRSASKAAIQIATGNRTDAKLNYISGLWNIKY